MPRGRRSQANLTIDEKIELTKAAIEQLRSELAQKKNELKKLEMDKKAEESKRLMDAAASTSSYADDNMSFIFLPTEQCSDGFGCMPMKCLASSGSIASYIS